MKEKGKHIAGGTHKTPLTEGGKAVPKAKYDDGKNEEETDKYLALEQEGITYTKEQDTEKSSDNLKYTGSVNKREWDEEGGNSKNSEAFNQDDYLLEDNVDLDEDQNQSVSSDDDDFEELNERYTS